jgi:ATP-binding cassette, subfamily B, bacterial
MRCRRVPVLMQSTAVECGAACLAMILSGRGRHTGVAELRERMSLARDGATAANIAQTSRKYGLDVRAFRADLEALPRLRVPFIAHWGMNHFVVVEKVSSRGANIVDPAAGRRRVGLEELDAQFTGVALEFGRGDALERRSRGRLGLLSFVAPYMPRTVSVAAAIILASTAITLLGLLPALLTSYVVDHLIPGQDPTVVSVLAIGLAGYAVAHSLVTMARSELLLWLQVRMDWSMMGHFLRHLMSLPYAFFQIRRGGDLLVRVSSMVYVRDVVSTQTLAVLLDAALLGIYLTVIGFTSLSFLVVIVSVALFQVAIMAVSAPRAQRLAERELQALGEAQSLLLESVTGAETVKATGAEEIVVERWSRRFAEQLDASMSRRRLDNFIVAALGMTTVGAPVLLLVLGARFVLLDGMSTGTMLSLVALAGAALAPVTQLGNSVKSFQVVRVHLQRLRDVLDEEPEAPARDAVRVSARSRIELRGVNFRYGAEGPEVLSSVDLVVEPGELVAIVGQSGSGKSTLARLLLGLYRPSAGQVLIGGVPVDRADLRDLRRQCGVVTQDADMFSGSLLTNIALVAPESTLDDIVRAARRAAIHDDVVAMPMGYETVLGEGGTGLSGGQRQRVALARALVHEPDLLLLDEATSHLDSVTERTVHENLAALSCTRVVIAHRLSTVRDADRIVVLDRGRVVEIGDHDSLLGAGGHYAMLVARQMTEPRPEVIP